MDTRSVHYCNYTVGADAYGEVGEICRVYGRRALLIGGEKAMAAALPRLEAKLAATGVKIVESVVYGEECTYSAIRTWADYAKSLRVDMIFGMGGGKALDTAKGAGEAAGLPVFTFPTSAATCAATTALSVVYGEDGNFDSFYFFRRPPYHCFIDLTVIAEEHSSALGREISNMCYEPLLEYGEQALADCEAHKVTTALEQAVLANIVSTGLVSLMVLDDYNCAIAHSVYYGLVLLPGFEEKWLHGNVVSYGVLVQLAVDGDLQEAVRLKAFLKKLRIPTTLREMGVPVDREYLQAVLTETVTGPDMAHIPYPVTEDMVFAAMETVENLPQ